MGVEGPLPPLDQRVIVKHRLTCKAMFDIWEGMDIESITHKGLRRFVETGNAKGLVGDANRIRRMLAYIDAVGRFDELAAPPNYGLHELVGDRAGRWAMTVTKNWRLTFIRIDETTIADLDLEDDH